MLHEQLTFWLFISSYNFLIGHHIYKYCKEKEADTQNCPESRTEPCFYGTWIYWESIYHSAGWAYDYVPS